MTLDLDNILADNQARLRRISKQYAGPNDWQDLMQEIALNLWRGLAGFDGRAQLSTWVYRVAVNTALQYVRKKRPTMVELGPEPIGAACTGDPMAILDAFLSQLDPVNRALLLLDLEGVGREQIAEVLGLSTGAVAVRMTRLKARFSEQFVETA